MTTHSKQSLTRQKRKMLGGRPTIGEIMSRIRRRDTGPELVLRSALWRTGIRGWRNDLGRLLGRPDIAFCRARVAVFVDGRLWHGHPSKYPGALSPYWLGKIAHNRERDAIVNEALREKGWEVVRLWDTEVLMDPDSHAIAITALVRSRLADG